MLANGREYGLTEGVLVRRRKSGNAPVERVYARRIGQSLRSRGEPSGDFGKIDRDELGLQHSCSSRASQIANHARFGVVFLVKNVRENLEQLFRGRPPPRIAQCFLLLSLDVRHPLRLFQLGETFALAPGVASALFLIDLFVTLRELEQIGMVLLQPHPFRLPLEETEIAPRARAP